jgi:hypothetical protein
VPSPQRRDGEPLAESKDGPVWLNRLNYWNGISTNQVSGRTATTSKSGCEEELLRH